MSRFPPRILTLRFLVVFLAAVFVSFSGLIAKSSQQDSKVVKPLPVPADKLVALVIGNTNYQGAPLHNSINDASDIAASLRSFGFEVVYKENLDLKGTKQAIDDWVVSARGAKVGWFYYAGYGVQFDGVNYLVPIGARVTREDEIPSASISVSLIVEQMKTALREIDVVVLDAAHGNPFGEKFRLSTIGLSPMEAPKGTLIAYSGAPGAELSDKRNGLYAGELIRAMSTPNLGVEGIFKRASNAVSSLTQDKQVPWVSSSLDKDNAILRPLLNPSLGPGEGVGIGAGEAGGIGPAPVRSPTPEVPYYERVFSQRDVDQRAVILSNPKAGYTEEGRQNKIQGIVVVRLILSGKGTIEQIRIVKGLPFGLNEKAIAAARQIKFQPALKDGHPVSVSIGLEYSFNLY